VTGWPWLGGSGIILNDSFVFIQLLKANQTFHPLPTIDPRTHHPPPTKPCHTATTKLPLPLPNCHCHYPIATATTILATLPLYHLPTCPHYHITTLPLHYTATLPLPNRHCHPATATTQSPLPPCHCHTATLPPCHCHCHTTKLPLPPSAPTPPGPGSWPRHALLTPLLFFLPLFLTFCVLNSVAVAYGSISALPAGTVAWLVAVWGAVSLPLAVAGGVAGKNWGDGWTAPCRYGRK
jgi:hypothetical protein